MFRAAAQRGHELTILVVDGAAAVEVVIVPGYFEHALAGNVAAAQHVFQERNHVFMFFGTTEGQD